MYIEGSVIPALVTISIIAVPVLIGLITFLIWPYLLRLRDEVELRMGQQQFQFLTQILTALIHAAEQLTGLDTGHKKRQFVLEQARILADTYRIPVGDDQLEALLEGVLKEIKLATTRGVLRELLPDSLKARG